MSSWFLHKIHFETRERPALPWLVASLPRCQALPGSCQTFEPTVLIFCNPAVFKMADETDLKLYVCFKAYLSVLWSLNIVWLYPFLYSVFKYVLLYVLGKFLCPSRRNLKHKLPATLFLLIQNRNAEEQRKRLPWKEMYYMCKYFESSSWSPS